MKNNEDYQALLNFAEYEMKTCSIFAEAAEKDAATYKEINAAETAAWKEGQAQAYKTCAERLERMIKRIKGGE